MKIDLNFYARYFRGLLHAVLDGLKGAFEHPFGQLIFYGAMFSSLPLTFWPVMIMVVLSVAWHEFGHWSVARLNGYTVETYSIGMPCSRYLLLGHLGHTRVQMTPYWFLGGYVSFEPTDPHVMESSVWRRASVMLSGPAFNIIAAILFFAASYGLSGKELYHGTPVVSEVAAGVAANSGILAGDIIKSVNGKVTATGQDVVARLAERSNPEIKIELERQGKLSRIIVQSPPGERLGIKLGWTERLSVSPVEALSVGAEQTYKLFKEICSIVYSALFPFGTEQTHAPQAKFEVHSIVGFMQFASLSLTQGLNVFLAVVAVLNVNLAFLNLLPIPVLDGGHLLFLSIEKLRGKPVSVELQMKLVYVFLWLLIAVALFGLYNDIHQPFVHN